MSTVTLYSKPECPLCDKAEAQLRKIMAGADMGLEIVDITRDDDLYARYWAQIPVIAFPDGRRLFAPIDEAELRRALRRQRRR